MSARMQYPLSQRRHTNVATVRYQKNGVRLEIACYKNKVISYRSGTESRLDEVLQVDRVFSNVARGHVASKEDIAAVFGKDTTEEEAIKIMLEHGELQVAQQERAAETDEIAKSIALLIAQRCVNTKTQRPFPVVVIEQALKSIGAGVKLDQPAKKQALGLIHQLVESQIIPIARANMKLRCLTPTEDGVAALDKWCLENGAQVVERKTTVAGDAPDGPEKPEARTSLHSLLVLVQPHLFRDLDTLVKAKLPAGSSMHMVDAAAMEMGESNASVIMGSAAALSSTGVGGGGGSMDLDSNCGSQPQCGLPGGGSSFVASADRDADGGGGKRKGKKDLRKQSRRGGRGKTVSSDEDDRRGADRGSQSDADEEENTNKKGQRRQRGQRSEAAQAAPDAANLAEADALAAELMKLGLDPTKDFNENDEEEGHGPKGRKGKGKNKGKGGRGGNPPQQEQPEPTAGGKQSKQQQQTTAPVKEVENGSDSDEELSGNRRQRKKNTQRQQQQQQRNAQPYSNGSLNPSDEDYNYGEDEEEEAVPS